MIAATLTPQAAAPGLTHGSSRALAKNLKTSNGTIALVWRAYGIQPWRSEGFRFSTGPELEAKVGDVVGRTGTHRRTQSKVRTRWPHRVADEGKVRR